MAEQEHDSESRPFHTEGGSIVFDKPPSEEERRGKAREDEQHEFARSQVKTNKQLAWFTGALVFATFCTIGVGVWQAVISQRAARGAQDAANAATSAAETADKTLKEMQHGQGAADTHTLAQQAVTQATQTTALATAAGRQADASNRLATEAGRSASASNTANKQASDFFAQQNRPWIGLFGPITLTKITEGIHQQIEFTTKIKNFGTSPGFEVIPKVDLVVGERTTDVRPLIDEVCKFVESTILPLKAGEIVFPGDDHTFPTEGFPDISLPKIPTNPNDPVYFFPGCIVYLDSDNKVHHTEICQWTDRDNFKVGATFSSCSRPFAD